jgi:hypothetical protein
MHTIIALVFLASALAASPALAIAVAENLIIQDRN